MGDKSDSNDVENPYGRELFLVFPLLDQLIVNCLPCGSSAWLK